MQAVQPGPLQRRHAHAQVRVPVQVRPAQVLPVQPVPPGLQPGGRGRLLRVILNPSFKKLKMGA